MRVLSVWGPWAQLLALGIKDVENRVWATNYRGPMAIHCTKTGWSAADAVATMRELCIMGLIDSVTAADILRRCEEDRGKVIGVVDVVGSRPANGHPSPWAADGQQCIEVVNARALMPIEHTGGQGLRHLPPELRRRFVTDLRLNSPEALYTWGVLEAADEWGANCGPVALAGALRVPLGAVREALGASWKGYMGQRDIKAAVGALGGRVVREWSKPDKREILRTGGETLIVLMRWLGPWDDITDPRARARAQARHRHIFAYRHGRARGQTSEGVGWVLDANNLVRGPGEQIVATWAPREAWREHVLGELAPERSTGETAIAWMAEIAK